MSLDREPIAIVGSAGRFPGGCNTPSKLWELLRKPRDLLSEIPKERFNIDAFYHPDPLHHGTTNTRQSYFLDEDPSKFDAQFFSITPAEAESMDPQQRLLMETVYDSLCTAGLPIESLRGSATGVYIGLMCDDWSSMIQKDIDALPTYTGTGTARSIMSNRISYFFDWHGPSMTIDTACSSSLVAVHEAVRLLRSGDSKVAVAAGANLILNPAQYVAESNLRMLSPTGRSRMWDASADGYARGEGIASVVLKTLSQAIEDGDTIECVIRETGVNQDGRTSGLTVPSNTAQSNLIRDTYKRAGLDVSKPSDRPQLFHAHGTGTKAGDPQEAEAIHNAFFNDALKDGESVMSKDKLFVHSIKTIIGHTEGTAGLASLIGTSLAIRNSTIPPNMHFQKLNPDIAPFYAKLQVPTAACDWPKVTAGAVKRASINSFGFGGTNAHAIVEEYVADKRPSKSTLTPKHLSTQFTPFVFSAANPASLRVKLAEYFTFLTQDSRINLRDLAWTLQHRSSTLHFREAIAARSYDDLCRKLAEVIKDDKDGDIDTRSANLSQPKILGVFTGQGAQWPRMGARLLEKSPFVAQRIHELDASLASLPETDRPTWTISEQLLADANSSRLSEAALSQPLCTAVQILLVDFLSSAGINLTAVIGHSSGEIGAAYAAGLLSAHDAICIAYYRGLHATGAASPNNKEIKGAMAAIGVAADEAEDLIDAYSLRGRISVAAHNSTSSLTISGDEDAIEEAVGILKSRSAFARRLKVDTAYHSAHMQACAKPYLESLNACGIKPLKPTSGHPKWLSSVTEGMVMTPDHCGSQYWVDNMTHPVLFSGAVGTAVDAIGDFDLAVELGPHPALKGPAMNTLAEMDISIPYSGLLSRGKDDVEEFSSAIGLLWRYLSPGSVDFNALDNTLHGDDTARTVLKNLPAYPFHHQHSYWAEARASKAYKQLKTTPSPVLGMPSINTSTASERQWRNVLSPREIPWLQGHKLQGQIIFPATGYIAMALEAVRAIAGEKPLCDVKITNLRLERAIGFSDEQSCTETLFSVKINQNELDNGNSGFISASFSCHSCPEGDQSMARNATGFIEVHLDQPMSDTLPIIPKRGSFNMVDVSIDRFYSTLASIGYHYSEPFKGMSEIRRKMGVAQGTLLDQSASAWEDQLLVHPGMLDTALQTLFAAFSYPGDESLRSLHVPVQIDSITINPYFSAGKQRAVTVPWETVVRDDDKSHIKADLQLYSEDSQHTFVQVEGVSLKPFTAARPEDDATVFSHFEYLRDGPDGESAAVGDRLSPEELRMAKDMERLAFFYLRQLSEISAEERVNALAHHQHLMAWADYTVDKVRKSEHPSVPTECLKDTQEQILALTDRYRDRVDALLIESTGQNLPATIRAKDSILRHMTKDNLLGRFYEEGVGLSTANWWLAGIVRQISHRYPHMKILEIGAGTGGATQAALSSLGTSFSSYTYTDVSSGFFEAAEDKFRDYADRMIFKVFDMSKPATDQGFTEGSYDVILASNVLHVAEDLDGMMNNVRKLLRPGGFVVNLETVTNQMLRNGIIMGGLPGWWIGAESGRPHGPMLDLDSWDGLLKRCGFDGIETSTPVYDSLHAVAVWVAQATDDRVKTLKSPLDSPEAPSLRSGSDSHLVVVGGNALSTYHLLQKLKTLLSPRFSSFQHVPSVEALEKQALPAEATILSIADLDEPVMKGVTEDKMQGLKAVWAQGRNILWVTRGCRYDEPYQNMMYGVGRVVRFENPNINLQLLDIDTESFNDQTAEYISESLLRHQTLDEWQRRGEREDLLWSSEPEVFLEKGVTLIPRLYLNKSQNARYNSSSRRISRNVHASQADLRLVRESSNAVNVEEVTALEQIAAPIRSSNALRKIRIEQSLLQSIHISQVGNMMLVTGIDEEDPQRTVLALTSSSTSPAMVDPSCLVDIPADKEFARMAMITVAAHLAASQIVGENEGSQSSTVVVHESDKLMKTAIAARAKASNVKLVFTTSQSSKRGNGAENDYVYIHPALPTRLLKEKINADTSLFVDFSLKGSKSAEIGKAISRVVPEHCVCKKTESFFGQVPHLQPGCSISNSNSLNSKCLKRAWEDAQKKTVPLTEAGQLPLGDISFHNAMKEPLSIVDWATPSSTVPVTVRPVDDNDIFRPDRTYLLIGLSGEVGQSLCEWMVRHGARHVVLTSRNPIVEQEFIRSLEARGAHVRAMSLDITSRESLNSCLATIKRTMPPIAGVSNGALIVADAPFQEMDVEGMNKVLRPKVDGTILLDEAFRDVPLDFFIMFSSLTACLGNSGQSNYAAANMFMTTIAFQRKKRGVPGSVIDLSALMGIGHVGRSDAFDAAYFKSLGATSVSESDLHQMFAEAILAGRPDSQDSAEIVTGMSPMTRAELEGTRVQYRADLKFGHLCIEESGAGRGDASDSSSSKVPVRTQLKSVKTRSEATKVLLDSFLARVKKVLQIPADDVVSGSEPLIERGVDSLVALDIRSWFMRELDVDMPVLRILEGSSSEDLIKDSMQRVSPSILDTSSLSQDSDVAISAASALKVPTSHLAPETASGAQSHASGSRSTSPPADLGCSEQSGFSPEDSAESISSLDEHDDVSSDEAQSEDKMKATIDASTETVMPMSFGQTRFWFLHHALEDRSTFNVAVSVRLEGHLDVTSFEKALSAVSKKHEAMRTRYFWGGHANDEPMQGILSEPVVQLEHRHIADKSEATKALEEIRDYEWDLNSWRSMRFVLLSCSDDTQWLILGCHHITIDGVSIQLIFADLEKAYQGQTLSFIPEESQYRTYSTLQRQAFEDGHFQKDIDFYRNIIPSDVQPVDLLPFSKLSARQPQTSYKTHRADIRLDASTTSRIKRAARQNQATNFHLYLAVLQALLFRSLPDTNELFIGIADANRNDEKFMSTVGFFLNLLPIRFDRPSAKSQSKSKFSAAVKDARNKVYAALEHSHLPFDVLLSELGITRSANHPPVFQVFVDYRQGTQERAKFASLDAAGEEWYHPRTGYDISLDLLENAEGDTLVTLQLQQSLYTEEQTEMFLRAYVTLLNGLTKTPGRDIPLDLPAMWAEEDISRALDIGAGPDVPLTWPETVSHRVDDMITQHGSSPALRCGQTSLTYNEMGQQVNAIAQALAESGINNSDVVGVYQKPGSDWVCSMLAVFRVGATYLPLDGKNSIHRLRYAVETTKPSAVLVDADTITTVGDLAVSNVAVIDVSASKETTTAPHQYTATRSQDAAVILFTSGSTGEPKGVVIKHSNLVAQNEGFSRQCDVAGGKASKVLQQSAMSFDFSMEQILIALCNGGCLHIVPESQRGDPYEITKMILREGISYTTGTPSEYEMWFQFSEEHLSKCHDWNYAFFGGEPFSADFLAEFRALNLPGLEVVNNYGPSETTIACTHLGRIDYRTREAQISLPAGFAAPNYSLYIVDSQLKPLPLGVPGEILIGGVGVTAGYFGLDSMTKERFIPNNFIGPESSLTQHGWTTMFRTGDCGYLREDGALVVRGRIDGDTQCKIRGFRVELGEVENVLLETSQGALKHAAVTLRESDGVKFLAAHVVFSKNQPETGRTELLARLQAQLPLPDYMRPAVIVALEQLPLTAHAKFDRAAIKALSLDQPISSTRHVSSDDFELTPTEAKLERVWRDILPVAPPGTISPQSNFFHIGGSSLLLVKLQRIIKQEFSAAPKLVELMNAGKLGDMAAVIVAATSDKIDWEAETSIPVAWYEEFGRKKSHAEQLVNSAPTSNAMNVLLTGPTGYLGRHIVPALVEHDQVHQIFVIVREESDIETLSHMSDKITIFTGDLGKESLGLPRDEFDRLSAETSVILHCGANRSFWDDYEVLRPVNTSSVKQLARLALPRRVPLHFISSGSVRIYGMEEGPGIYNINQEAPSPVPPEDGTDGYVASKWAAERFLRAVAAEFKLPVTLHAPMPTPDCGPDDTHAQPEPDHMVNELVSITKKLQVRPTMEGLNGWVDIIPTKTVVQDLMEATLEPRQRPTADEGSVSLQHHTGVRRINWRRFMAELRDNPELNGLPTKDTLLWIGQAKKSGYSYFMPAHRLVVVSEEGDMVSRR